MNYLEILSRRMLVILVVGVLLGHHAGYKTATQDHEFSDVVDLDLGNTTIQMHCEFYPEGPEITCEYSGTY